MTVGQPRGCPTFACIDCWLKEWRFTLRLNPHLRVETRAQSSNVCRDTTSATALNMWIVALCAFVIYVGVVVLAIGGGEFKQREMVRDVDVVKPISTTAPRSVAFELDDL